VSAQLRTTVQLEQELSPGSWVSYRTIVDQAEMTAIVPACGGLPDYGPRLLFVWTESTFGGGSTYTGLLDDEDAEKERSTLGVSEARVSPDGKWMAYVNEFESAGTTFAEIYLLDRSGVIFFGQQLTTGNTIGALFSQIEWSRDGKRLTCVRNIRGSDTIVVIEIPPDHLDDDSGVDALVASTDLTFGSEDADPTWGPGDREIAFTRNGKLHRVDVESGKVVVDSRETGTIYGLAWSPDGNSLVYSKGVEFDSDILVLREGESTATNITSGPKSTEFFANPEWAPDSDTLVFTGYVATSLLYSKKISDGPAVDPELLPVSSRDGNFIDVSVFLEPTE